MKRAYCFLLHTLREVGPCRFFLIRIFENTDHIKYVFCSTVKALKNILIIGDDARLIKNIFNKACYVSLFFWLSIHLCYWDEGHNKKEGGSNKSKQMTV
ncbi:uncharacterized protein LOC132037908 [Lycium ferocissimum]|uniref:uncharacterized protein LOC132037908 n=1 Tax=Lycium ferocissimum TaxID=112874 RepID=UPI0028168878|nr:uncharacterized protein LOC132037908 [Lycium ferocissimum]